MEPETNFMCALATVDPEGNTTTTTPVAVPRELLGIVAARLLPVAIDCGFALEVSG